MTKVRPAKQPTRYIKPNPFAIDVELQNNLTAWRAYYRSNACFDYMIDNKAARAPLHMIGACY